MEQHIHDQTSSLEDEKTQNMEESVGSRAKHIGKEIVFAVGLLAPLEVTRALAMTVSFIPLLLFMGGEYIITGDNENRKNCRIC